jgi:hypothetical protein
MCVGMHGGVGVLCMCAGRVCVSWAGRVRGGWVVRVVVVVLAG